MIAAFSNLFVLLRGIQSFDAATRHDCHALRFVTLQHHVKLGFVIG